MISSPERLKPVRPVPVRELSKSQLSSRQLQLTERQPSIRKLSIRELSASSLATRQLPPRRKPSPPLFRSIRQIWTMDFEPLHPEEFAKTEQKKAKLHSQILRVKVERDFEKQRQEQKMALLTQKLEDANKKFDEMITMFLGDVSLRSYAPYMRSNVVPSYLVILQAQVLSQLHKLCVVTEQARLVDKLSNAIIAECRKESFVLTEEKTRLELKLVNSMAKVQAEEVAMHEKYGAKLKKQTKKIKKLKKVVKQDDEIDNLIEQIADQGVRDLRNSTTVSTASRPYESDAARKQNTHIKSSKDKKKSLSLQEMLNMEKPMHTKHESIAGGEDERSIMSFSVKMSQSFSHLIWREKDNNVVSL